MDKTSCLKTLPPSSEIQSKTNCCLSKVPFHHTNGLGENIINEKYLTERLEPYIEVIFCKAGQRTEVATEKEMVGSTGR